MRGIQEMGALFIGGLVFISLIGLYGRINGSAVTQTLSTVVQEQATTSVDIMEHELRDMGYGIADSAYILRADSAGITFRLDLADSGRADTVTYAVGPGWSDPSTFTVYRTLDAGTAAPVATGLTQCAFLYRNSRGQPPASPGDIRSITVTMTMQGDMGPDGRRAGEYWERTIRPDNLR